MVHAAPAQRARRRGRRAKHAHRHDPPTAQEHRGRHGSSPQDNTRDTVGRTDVSAAVEAGALVHLLPGWRFAGVPVSVVATHARDRLPGVRTVADMLLAALAELA